MPLSPAQRRKISAAKIEQSISLSQAEKNARSTAKKEARDAQKEAEDATGVPAWAVTLIAVAVFGSVIAQLYFTIVNAPAAFGGNGEEQQNAGEQ
jgi:hypothetical protein